MLLKSIILLYQT